MDISLNKNNQLTLKNIEPTQLKKLRSMLIFWDFEYDNESFRSPNSDLYITLQKVLKYCEKIGVEARLSSKVEELQKLHKEKDSQFENKKELCRDYKDGNLKNSNLDEFVEFLSNDLARPLRDHQVKAACHLYLAENGANFSVPGAGKTSVVVSVYEKRKREGKVNTMLVIGPTTCFESWETEFFKTIGRKPKTAILAGGDKYKRKSKYHILDEKSRPEIYITSFQTLLNDQDDVIDLLKDPEIKSFVVIDEAHYIKRLNGRWSNAAMRLSRDSDYRCILTGTPLPRSYTDFYNQFEFLYPDNNPISSQTKSFIEGIDSNDTSNQVNDLFDYEVGPLHYRVRKDDLGLADQNFYEPIMVPQNPIEKEIYEAINNHVMNLAKDDYLKEVDLVNKLRRGRIIRLRQAVSYPKLLSSALKVVPDPFSNSNSFNDSKIAKNIQNYDSLEVPNKINALMTLVSDLNERGEKLIIWSSFVNTIKYISNWLSQYDIKNEKIYGEIPFLDHPFKEIKSRTKIKNIFLDPNSGLDVIIANPAAFAESVSLHTTCSNAIYYDLSYNCAQFLQSLDRIHRVGGSEEKEANYYFLQYENTIDQDIFQLIMSRRDRMNNLIDQDYEIFSLDMFEDDDEDLKAYERMIQK